MLCVAILLIFAFPVTSFAKINPSFVNNLAQAILKDCRGSEIELRPGYVSEYKDGEESETIIFAADTLSYQELSDIIEAFTLAEPFNFYRGNRCTDGPPYDITHNRSGCGLLSCGSHGLDGNGAQYFWDGKRVQQPPVRFGSFYDTGGMDGNKAFDGNGSREMPKDTLLPTIAAASSISAVMTFLVTYFAMRKRRQK